MAQMRGILLYFLILPFLFSLSLASEQDEMTINSVPSGATVYVEGEHTFVGKTPLKVPYLLVGTYRITASKRGYEDWSQTVNLVGKRSGPLLIRFSPKTRFKAALRSSLFPGWGQYYLDKRLKGGVISFAMIGLALSSIVLDAQYDREVDRYNQAWRDYDAAKREEEKLALKLKVLKREEKTDDVYNRRNTLLWMMGTLWAYNILDALIFFPSFQRGGYDLGTPVVSGVMEKGVPMVRLTINF
jgi:hypothetical protein